MALTKVTGKGITCSAVTEDKLGTSAVTTNKIGPDAVTSAKINNGAVTADDLASTLDLSSKTVTLPSDVVSDLKRPVQDNIALLGFKMAVNDGLTVFNLVDGVVDEFNDESGTDEAEGSNDLYNSTDDYYINSNTPDGGPNPFSISAGFTKDSITEPDTSTAGTNPTAGTGTAGTFTVPCGLSSITVNAWGSGGGFGYDNAPQGFPGGGGGYTVGTLAVTGTQSINVFVGEGGYGPADVGGSGGSGGTSPSQGGGNGSGAGGGATVLSNFDIRGSSAPQAPGVFLVAGSGGSGGYKSPQGAAGGAGGGTTGCTGGTNVEQTNRTGFNNIDAGGGSQTVGGQGGAGGTSCRPGQTGGFLKGGNSVVGGGGGAGFYGGGGGGDTQPSDDHGGGGGGSGYIGHPQITCGSLEEGGSPNQDAGAANPYAPSCSGVGGTSAGQSGQDGYVLLTGCGTACATATSTTIVSDTFTSNSVATSARIVVFEENVDTPTLNTDIIASISRDGTNFTNATLTDSGYVTGSSGQRILTGQADISGQPSGQSMRWKLALANNTVKIHGVALQWS